MSFARALAFVLDQEGDHSDDPGDAGGDTWYGISRLAYPTLTPWPPTREQAEAIYLRDFWTPIQGDQLPPALALVVFDTAVNMGAETAVLLLQRALRVLDDGVIGSRTLAAATTADVAATVLDLLARRVLRYTTRPTFPRFGLGWIRRVMAAHAAALGVH